MSLLPPVRLLVRATVSTVALAALAVPVAASAAVEVDCSADNSALLAAAQNAVDEAKAGRLSVNRPLGLLSRNELRDTRDEVAVIRATIQELRNQLRSPDLTADQRAALETRIAQQSALVRHAQRILEFRQRLLSELKGYKNEADVDLAAATAALDELEAALDACG